MTPPVRTGTEEGEFPWWLVALALLGAVIAALIILSDLYTQVFWTVAKGLGITVMVTLIAFSLATALGLGVALLGLSGAKVLRQAARFYVELIRGIRSWCCSSISPSSARRASSMPGTGSPRRLRAPG